MDLEKAYNIINMIGCSRFVATPLDQSLSLKIRRVTVVEGVKTSREKYED